MNRIEASLMPLKPPGPRPVAPGDQGPRAGDVKKKAAPGAAFELGSLRPPGVSVSSELRSFGSPVATVGPGPRSLTASPEATTSRDEVAKAGREFETILLRYLVGAMRSTIGDAGGGGMQGAHFYQGLIEEQLGRVLADSGRGLRLAELLQQQLGRTGEGDGHGSS